MTFTGTAAADVPNDHSGSPSVDQYVESVPTGTGDRPRPRGTTDKAPAPAPMPAKARRELESGDAAARDLGDVATNTDLGAPSAAAMARQRDRKDAANGGSGAPKSADGAQPAPSAPDVSPTAAVAKASSGDSGALWLVLAIAVMTGATVAVVLRRRAG